MSGILFIYDWDCNPNVMVNTLGKLIFDNEPILVCCIVPENADSKKYIATHISLKKTVEKIRNELNNKSRVEGLIITGYSTYEIRKIAHDVDFRLLMVYHKKDEKAMEKFVEEIKRVIHIPVMQYAR